MESNYSSNCSEAVHVHFCVQSDKQREPRTEIHERKNNENDLTLIC